MSAPPEMLAALAEAKERRAKALAVFEASVRKHHADGLNPVEISRRLGCSKGKVQSAVTRLGLKPRPPHLGTWRSL